ncbi:hypothetical protein [Bradyrhizobium sp. HKCCYLS20291]|uniref:hypothetical protein n=1 Tax=Bradyrhizobium sp. HKCCYLS20291 TaxID=3420766 RepID=UPI003EBE8603
MNGAISRSRFLGFAGLIALAVGGIALGAPEALLASKGIVADAAASVWMREVGAALVSIGFIIWRIRNEPDSLPMLAILWGGAVLNGLLLPIEIWAYADGTIRNLAGIIPNSVLHVVLGIGFLNYAFSASRT